VITAEKNLQREEDDGKEKSGGAKGLTQDGDEKRRSSRAVGIYSANITMFNDKVLTIVGEKFTDKKKDDNEDQGTSNESQPEVQRVVKPRVLCFQETYEGNGAIDEKAGQMLRMGWRSSWTPAV
jgi:hypothetical protein